MEKSNEQIALDYYNSHLKSMKKYYEKNRDTINNRSKNYFQNLKNDPEKYKLYLEKKKQKWRETHPKENPPVI